MLENKTSSKYVVNKVSEQIWCSCTKRRKYIKLSGCHFISANKRTLKKAAYSQIMINAL